MSDQRHNQSNIVVPTSKIALPAIPDKIYFTIGEVSELCRLKPHVLRYWEEEFLQLKPTKRKGNRRYYLREDVLLVRKIKNLLYEQGFTIEGAKTKLFNEKADKTKTNSLTPDFIDALLLDLKNVLAELK